MGNLVYSEKLEQLLEDREDLRESADGTCTSGYDNDGSTGLEIFENGYRLGTQAGDANVYYCDDGECAYFFIYPGNEGDFIESLPDEDEDEDDEDEEEAHAEA